MKKGVQGVQEMWKRQNFESEFKIIYDQLNTNIKTNHLIESIQKRRIKLENFEKACNECKKIL